MAKTKKELIMEYKERKDTGGVCLYQNTVNGRYLVHGTPNLAGAKSAFEFALITGTSCQMAFQEDWKQMGGGSFTFTILESIDKKPEQSPKEFREDIKALAEMYSQGRDEALSY